MIWLGLALILFGMGTWTASAWAKWRHEEYLKRTMKALKALEHIKLHAKATFIDTELLGKLFYEEPLPVDLADALRNKAGGNMNVRMGPRREG